MLTLKTVVIKLIHRVQVIQVILVPDGFTVTKEIKIVIAESLVTTTDIAEIIQKTDSQDGRDPRDSKNSNRDREYEPNTNTRIVMKNHIYGVSHVMNWGTKVYKNCGLFLVLYDVMPCIFPVSLQYLNNIIKLKF